jgi:hypothetical protein
MRLRITPPAKGKKLVAEIYDGDKLVHADTLDAMDAKAVARLVNEVTGRGFQLTGEQVLALRRGGEIDLVPLASAPVAADNGARLRIIRRKKYHPASAGLVFNNITDALADGAEDNILEWDNIELLAVLDVDYHDLLLDDRPQPFQLEALALIVRPKPVMFWISKGRGLHLIYEPVAGLTAEEAAACAGLHVKQLDAKCTFEVIARTSYPPGGEVWT